MTVAIYGRSIEPEFFPYLKRLVEGLERKGVGMVCEEKFAALLSGNYGYEPKFLNCFGTFGVFSECTRGGDRRCCRFYRCREV